MLFRKGDKKKRPVPWHVTLFALAALGAFVGGLEGVSLLVLSGAGGMAYLKFVYLKGGGDDAGEGI